MEEFTEIAEKTDYDKKLGVYILQDKNNDTKSRSSLDRSGSS